MTEETTAEVAEVVTEAAPEAAVSSPERDFEKEAREIGWVPETEFKGDKEKWKPAQKFVEDGEKILPIVRSQLKRTQEELSKREADFTKRLERMERMSNTAVERLKAQHKAELDRIQGEKLEAVEAGDTARYKVLDKQERELATAKFDELEPVAPADPGAVFKKDNPWYGEDEDLTAYADGISQAYLAKHPNSTLEENLAHTAEKVKAAFPSKFSKKPAANGHAAVDGGGDFPNVSVSKSSLVAKLPGEALKQAKADVAAGLYKTEEAWAKVYFG